MANSIHTEILLLIQQLQPGEIIFPSDFLHLGSVAGVNMALSRLARTGILQRLAQGIYVYPKKDPLIGPVRPSLEEIASAIAQKEHVRIRPTGATALNKLGWSTQVPMRVSYLTDGNPRTIKVGKGTLTFKKSTPKIMSVKGSTNFLVIQALQTLGKDAATDTKFLLDIYQLLKSEDVTTLRQDAKLAPAWIAQVLYKIANQIEQDGNMAPAS
jgi:hypothetical protein